MSFRNEGTADRIVRVTVGVGMLVLGFTGIVGGTLGTVLAVLGFVPLLTGLAGWCPLYALFGVSTCPADLADSPRSRVTT